MIMQAYNGETLKTRRSKFSEFAKLFVPSFLIPRRLHYLSTKYNKINTDISFFSSCFVQL